VNQVLGRQLAGTDEQLLTVVAQRGEGEHLAGL
jgi:hypothetical protein